MISLTPEMPSLNLQSSIDNFQLLNPHSKIPARRLSGGPARSPARPP
jgi:hypothetical protein